MTTTTATINDHYWRHFSDTMANSQFYQRHFSTEPVQHETGNQDAATTTTYDECDPNIGGEYDDVQEPTFRSAAAGANRTTTSNAERRHLQRHSPSRSTNMAIPAADVKPAYECVQKPKTRAERRAIDPEQIEEPAEVRPAKKERRSDWAQRDDEGRRLAARMFKNQTQDQVLIEEDEDDSWWIYHLSAE